MRGEALPALSPDLAEKLLRANLTNVGRKLRRGKTLNRDELRLLRAAGNGAGHDAEPCRNGDYPRNQAALARALGVSRKSVTLWQRIPGNPGKLPGAGFPVAAWRAWAEARRDDSRVTAGAPPGLKTEYLTLRNDLLKHEIGILKRDYVLASDVRQWGAELGLLFRRVVLQLHLKAPGLVGLSVAEIEACLRDAEQEILDDMQTLGARLEAATEPTRNGDSSEVESPPALPGPP